MKRVGVIGECMIELFEETEGLYRQTFGGDSFNCAVYLKRELPSANVEYITLLGDDELSSKMLKFFKDENVDTNFIKQLPKRFAGLYMIHTKDGERSFSYWRDNSPAKELFVNESYDELLKFDLIYFSGITLAIMSEIGRERLFAFVKQAREFGVKVAYDSNYRVKLYKSRDEAKSIHKLALSHCDIYLPSIDDEIELFEEENRDKIILNALELGCKEVVLTCGSESIEYATKEQRGSVNIDKLTNIVDTTSAGDSFNGAYLAARLENLDIKTAIKRASKLAAKVIMHKGAIIPKDI